MCDHSIYYKKLHTWLVGKLHSWSDAVGFIYIWPILSVLLLDSDIMYTAKQKCVFHTKV